MKWRSSYLDEIRGTLEPTKTTFRMWKGRRIAEKKPIPRQVYSHLQLYQRSLCKAALARWKTLSVDEKEYWKAEAGKIGLDGHNLYIQQYITSFGKPVSAWLFTEGSGTVLNDYYGLNNGTIYGATWTKIGNWHALSFDGEDDEIDLGTCNTLRVTELSLITFFKIRDTGRHQFIFEMAHPAYSKLEEGIRLMYHKDAQVIRLGVGDGLTTSWVSQSSQFTEWDKWVMIAATYSDSKDSQALYINNKLEHAVTTDISATFTNVTNAVIGHLVFGEVAEVRFYPYNLLSEEIAAIWQVYQKSPLFS